MRHLDLSFPLQKFFPSSNVRRSNETRKHLSDISNNDKLENECSQNKQNTAP